MKSLDDLLAEFTKNQRMRGKGALSVALVVTRYARTHGLPLSAESLLTQGGGQVAGLGKTAVQSILRDHGIERILAEEGGRTSRGSLGHMRAYVEFLNDIHARTAIDIGQLEAWWIERVREFFAAKPFVLRFDAAKSIRAVIGDLLAQADRRQSRTPGSTCAGTMLQHLVGAKLNLILDVKPEHYGANVADAVSGRPGDFVVADVAIHVTTVPGEALLRKCQANLENGMKTVIITTPSGAVVANALAQQQGIVDRIDVFEAEQFLAGNLYEIGKFTLSGRRTTLEQLVVEYNQIVEDCETDPSLRINLAK